MKFAARKTDLGLGIWEITLEGSTWEKFLENAKTTSINNVSVSGFRKGKVPLDIALQNINQNTILNEASRMAIKKGYQFAIEQKTDIKPFNEISPKIVSLDIKKCVINFNFDVKPEIEVKKYTGFNVPKQELKVSNSAVEAELKKVQERFAILEEKQGKVADKDHVIIDFVGKIDNKKFPGGEAKNYGLDIGSNSFIEGFEDALIGWTVNTKKDINLKFPNNYHVDDLKGKSVVFEVELKEIKSKKMPKLNDELIKDLNIKTVDTVDKYKNHIRTELLKQSEANEKNRVISIILDEISKDSKMIIPYSVIIDQTKKLFKEFENKVKSQNLTIEEYCKKTGLTLKNINSELIIDAKKSLVNYYILQYVVNKEKLNVSEEDINNKYKELAKAFSLPENDSRLKQYFPKESVENEIITTKATDFLYNQN